MPKISGIQHDGDGFARGHDCLQLQLHHHEFYGQGMWRHAIHWHIQEHKGSANSSVSHIIWQYRDRGYHDPNPQQSDLDGWNHGSHPGESQPTLCILYDSPRQPFYISPNFHSNWGPCIYASIVFQRDYTSSHQKNLHRKIAIYVPAFYLFFGTWVRSTECLRPQELV